MIYSANTTNPEVGGGRRLVFREYQGVWQRGVQHGDGLMKYTNGDRYEGDWHRGVREGRGEMKYSKSGHSYKGPWKSE